MPPFPHIRLRTHRALPRKPVLLQVRLDSSLNISRVPETYLHGLAGVDEMFAKCTQFCLTAFAHHAFSKRIRGGTRTYLMSNAGPDADPRRSPWITYDRKKRRR